MDVSENSQNVYKATTTSSDSVSKVLIIGIERYEQKIPTQILKKQCTQGLLFAISSTFLNALQH